MSVYLIPLQSALLLFPFLAAMITLPYIIIQYRKYGSILPIRVLIVYSFIFYLLCAYFLVLLPLPPMEEADCAADSICLFKRVHHEQLPNLE